MRKFGRIADKHTIQCPNVAVALERLFADHLLPHLPPSCLVNRNEFRTSHCYREGVDGVIKAERPTLKSIYDVYAAASANGKNDEIALIDSKKMSVGEWLTFVQHAGLFEFGMITYRQAMQAFSWSRIRSSSAWTHAEEIRMRQLTLEDFFEALVRIPSIPPVVTRGMPCSPHTSRGDTWHALLTPYLPW